MGEIARRTGGAIARAGEVLAEGLRYGLLTAQLGAAALAVRNLSASVRGAYDYVEGCAESVDRLADKAAALKVDDLTTSEHHDAAAVMRSVLEEAEAMAEAAKDLAAGFEDARSGHEGDYGPVVEAAQNMPDGIEMAEREFYSNR
ncbi:hypothetical protein ACWC9S_27130 [Streptomyces xiamenensis]